AKYRHPLAIEGECRLHDVDALGRQFGSGNPRCHINQTERVFRAIQGNHDSAIRTESQHLDRHASRFARNMRYARDGNRASPGQQSKEAENQWMANSSKRSKIPHVWGPGPDASSLTD